MSTYLIVFTCSFPYGASETWKVNDIRELGKVYDEVVVIPLIRGSGENSDEKLGSNVSFEPPLLNNKLDTMAVFTLFDIVWRKHREVFKEVKRATSGSHKVEKLIMSLKSLLRSASIIRTLSRKDFLSKSSHTDLFFYWGTGSAEILPWLKESFRQTIVCFHNVDLYPERVPFGYFPFRRLYMKEASRLYTVSEDGKKRLVNDNADVHITDKTFVRRLGARRIPRARHSEKAGISLLSLSYASRVKRIDLIVRALGDIDIPVEWTHIGGGEELNAIVSMASEYLDGKENIQYRFTGTLTSKEIDRLISSKPFDLFINVSDFEGLPVSIMEALIAGIPVLARDVGGIGEIVDMSVGYILPANSGPRLIKDKIKEFWSLDQVEKRCLSERAYVRGTEMCLAETLVPEFAMEIRKAKRDML